MQKLPLPMVSTPSVPQHSFGTMAVLSRMPNGPQAIQTHVNSILMLVRPAVLLSFLSPSIFSFFYIPPSSPLSSSFCYSFLFPLMSPFFLPFLFSFSFSLPLYLALFYPHFFSPLSPKSFPPFLPFSLCEWCITL